MTAHGARWLFARCGWVWLEISVELLAILRRAQMRRSRIVREIVRRVAIEMASHMKGRGLGPPPQPLVLTFPRQI